MFYKALGYAVWKMCTTYIRERYGRQIKIGAVLGIASIAIAGYLAARPDAD